ncbi:hypothetical protein RDI58_003586 [Solanum bulbocastanum]|uniref:Uncharacterized protein n=1 Tax=Solanum bulbocastanum TaxID=147425 RepID=A0AAN8YS94_SOLBU
MLMGEPEEAKDQQEERKYLLLMIMQNMVVIGLAAKSLMLNGLQMVQHLFL